MKLYNTLSHKIEEFKPQSNVVKIYTCGPTVYSFQHIGNYASYIYWDLLIRTLKANHYKVNRVINVTDVGHLVSDSDDGEDKMEKSAAREGKTVWDIAKFYEDDFFKNYYALNLTEPDKIAHATDYIENDISAVDKMTQNGFTYETTDGIYFDTSKFKNYAEFARLDLENLKAGARVDFNTEKKNPSDFAVWKFIKPGEKHAMRWQYLDRPGYPGWHLECSTIINKELGEPIDIHTGGVDHIPVHHTNEIAQTYAISGHQLANYWLHCKHITIEGQKMSKSLGNIYTLKDFEARGFSPMDFKMWVLSGTYQGERNFTFDSLEAAKNRRLNWRNRIAKCYQETVQSDPNIAQNILAELNDNLNSPAAFAVIDNANINFEDWQKIDEFFGLNLIQDSPNITAEQSQIITARQVARAQKDWQQSDKLRAKLEETGLTILDTKDGQIWQYLA